MPIVMMGVCVAVKTRLPDATRLELILDEHNVFKADIQQAYPDMLGVMPDEVRKIMPAQPWFRDDQEFLPLQVADLMAGSARRRVLKDPKALELGMTKMRIWPNSKVLDGQDMLKFAQGHTRQRLTTGRKPRPPRKGTRAGS
jgi:hypothetical protein